jgi:tetratricopeptide (TPR) repeat protein
LIAIILRLAQCQIQSNHLDQAARTYELAQKIAAQSGETKMESAASIAEAELRAAQGKTALALPLYQHALGLDRKLDDSQTTANDLYSYGLFLHNSGFSPRLAYACLLKSQSLMLKSWARNSKDTSEMKPVDLAREDLEQKLGGQSAELRRNPDSALQEALALTLP